MGEVEDGPEIGTALKIGTAAGFGLENDASRGLERGDLGIGVQVDM